MARAVTVWSDGGGVGKTTIVQNVASALARDGKDVLCIDLDPQFGGLTDQAGFPNLQQDDEYDVTEAMVNVDKSLRDVLVSGAETGLDYDLIPGSMTLTDFKDKLSPYPQWQNTWMVLRVNLNEAELWDEYDVILVDVPSGRGILAANAIVATRNVILPTELSRKGRRSAHGLVQYLEILEEGMRLNQFETEFGIIAVIPNDTSDTRSDNRSREKLDEMDLPICPFEIRHRKALFGDCQDNKMTVFEYAESEETRDLRGREKDTLEQFRLLGDVVVEGTIEAAKKEVTA